ncbi:MAG: hybrid sensor histidine kinase/response regulator [Oscillatoriales cyanobacterium]|jgi:two-component system, sensor histidine kinase and response regulator|uniref:hybrid sensor histidine kinase/response regulator n=1 Tax=unclassified Microcoleus TaxID=2642155 RepID=UPI001DB19BE4|nr:MULTISPECIES: hybrid sensor histidine kinase/response regulator [unclassified Microcoleus]TAE40428.1 MAG: hybrid sensor histidine kinase/response regulator [Oscillatoriales cyanobacterium]TAE66181.1 MAG: hybrid sensor histidine kinase/response regulator [Oscillatoriales cyanobacterium]TAG17372.1 MAG: hybrid sensor histidine kinase/response regulator [Oscillatoriales cyanobacterium]TAG45460.1 MAG: hybrid sensor histidine kinase/response regulator [Oscillatoriales cyanobacterium]TAG60618.1 MA
MNMPSILVIDDEPDNFDVIETLLNEPDYVLHYAASGSSAIASLKLFDPDVILLDVMMPEIDGIEVCKQIKAMPQWEPVPIIMVTALTTKEDLARCLEAGADDFISKPVNGIELRARLKSMLRVKQQYDRIESLSKLQENTIQLLQNNLDELCGNLVSTLPHELNTPLNGIFGVIGLLVDEYQDMSSEEVNELLVIAQKSALRLQKLTKRFLHYAQLEMFTSNPDFAETRNTHQPHISTQLLIENAIKAQAETVNRVNDLVWELENVEITMSERDFTCTLDELLENAFKFSKPGTPVQVSSQLKNETFYLSISDRGRGMTAEQIAQIGAFTQFERNYYQQQGIGLGLKIVKKIVELYGGNFGISSVVNEWTTVHIELSIKQLTVDS